jgi:hypothetical protein
LKFPPLSVTSVSFLDELRGLLLRFGRALALYVARRRLLTSLEIRHIIATAAAGAFDMQQRVRLTCSNGRVNIERAGGAPTGSHRKTGPATPPSAEAASRPTFEKRDRKQLLHNDAADYRTSRAICIVG